MLKDSKYREVRNFSIKNIFKFKKSLRKVNWNCLYAQGTQAAYSHFYDTIRELFNHHFPLQKREIKYYNKNPWISKELKKEILDREMLHLISKKHPTDSNIQSYKYIKWVLYPEIYFFLILIFFHNLNFKYVHIHT